MKICAANPASLTEQRLLKVLLDSRMQIKKRHKVIRQLHRLAIANNHVWQSPESSAKYEFLFERAHLKKIINIAHLKLSSSAVIKAVHGHPVEFANVVVASCHEPSFMVLINHTVPAAYGFFSCNEMLDMAIEFYCEIVDCCCDVRLMMKIVMPILTSMATFRFCEAVFEEYFRHLTVASRRGGAFIDFVVKYFELLPPQIMRLLRKISENFKTSFYFGKVFFAFMQQCAELWVPSCPYYHDVEAVGKFFAGLAKTTECVDKVRHLLFTKQSWYSLPSIIAFPDRPVMKLDMSMADMRNIAVLLNVMKKFPEGIHLAEFTKIPPSWEAQTFSVALYFQATPERTVKMTHSLLHGIDQDVLNEGEFERFAQAQLLICELDRHIEMSKLYEELVMGRCIARAIGEASSQEAMTYLIEKTSMVPRLRRRVILMRLTPSVLKIRQKWKRTMTEIDRAWSKCIAHTKRENTKRLGEVISPRVKSILTGKICELALIDNAILCDKFTILMSVFAAVETIQKSVSQNNVYLCVFESAPCKTLLSSILSVNVFGMWDRIFVSQCSEAENRVWLKLEGSVLQAFEKDQDGLDLYTKSQLHMGIELTKATQSV